MKISFVMSENSFNLLPWNQAKSYSYNLQFQSSNVIFGENFILIYIKQSFDSAKLLTCY